MFGWWIPWVCTQGWYAMPIQGMGFETGLGHGIGNGSTLQQNGIEPDSKIVQKNLRRRDRGQRTQRQKTQGARAKWGGAR